MSGPPGSSRVLHLFADDAPSAAGSGSGTDLRSIVTVRRGAGLPDADGHDAVVAPATVLAATPDLRRLEQWVTGGGSLVVTMTAGRLGSALAPSVARLAGLDGCGPALPHGEWMAAVAAPGHPVVERAASEFAVRGTFTPLEPAAARTLLTVSVAHRDVCAVAERRLGAGRVVTLGIDEDLAPGPSELGRIMERAQRRTDSERPHAPPTGVAVVGYGPHGGTGYAHALAVQATEGLDLVAVCDTNPDRRKEAELLFPGVRAYSDIAEVLVDDDVAVVVVATPPTTHAALGAALLRSGRHVVMEKPLCLTVAEADELTDAAAAHGVSLSVHHNRRFDPDFVALRSVVESGTLGEVFNVETFVGCFDHPCRAWHSDVTLSGGAAYDWGSHHLDWILLLLGSPPSRVSSTGHKRVWWDVTNLDQERIQLWWADGREAQFVHSDVAAIRRPKFYVQGTAGTLVGAYRPVVLERIEPGQGLISEHLHYAEAPAELRLVTYAGSGALVDTALPLAPERRTWFHRNVADHVRDGAPLEVPAGSVRPVVAILEAAARSSAGGGGPITLSPRPGGR